MRRALITFGVVLAGVFAASMVGTPAQAGTEYLYNEYTNPELCILIGQQGEASGQWIYYYCQEIAPEGDAGGQWDLWVEYAS